MGKLTDILNDGVADSLRSQWNEIEAADEFGAALPSAEYISHIIDGELISSHSKGTPGYQLTHKVIEGEHTNRRFWHTCWLTEAALPSTKRDLMKLGITSLDQLEKPLTKYLRCKVKLTKRRDDDGNESNRVRSFEVIGIDLPEQDDFAPPDNDDRQPGESETDAIDLDNV